MPEFDPTIAEEFGYGIAETQTFLGVPIFEADSIYNLLIRFGFNLLAGWILIHFAYFRRSRRRDYYLTFMLFSTTMFLLIFLMENVKLQIGFLPLRHYRTERHQRTGDDRQLCGDCPHERAAHRTMLLPRVAYRTQTTRRETDSL